MIWRLLPERLGHRGRCIGAIAVLLALAAVAAAHAIRAKSFSSPQAAPFDAGDALSRLPLAALAGRARGDERLLRAFVIDGIRRNPRDIALRRWLIRDRLDHGDIAAAVRQLDAVMRMRRPLETDLTSAMVPLLITPAGIDAIAARAPSHPPWLEQFLTSARTHPTAVPRLYALLQQIAAQPESDVSPAVVTATVELALQRGDVAQAQAVYAAFYPSAGRRPGEQLIDSDFDGLAGPPPFNWQFETGAGYRTALDTVGGLTVNVDAGVAHRLATEKVVVEPGAYDLTSSARSVSGGNADWLGWTVTCGADGSTLAQLRLAGLGQGRATLGRPVVVPPRCPWVGITLESRAIAVPGEASIQSVSLRRALAAVP